MSHYNTEETAVSWSIIQKITRQFWLTFSGTHSGVQAVADWIIRTLRGDCAECRSRVCNAGLEQKPEKQAWHWLFEED